MSGLVRFVAGELRRPGTADSLLAEQSQLRFRHLAPEPAGPVGHQVVFDDDRIFRVALHFFIPLANGLPPIVEQIVEIVAIALGHDREPRRGGGVQGKLERAVAAEHEIDRRTVRQLDVDELPHDPAQLPPGLQHRVEDAATGVADSETVVGGRRIVGR